MIKIITTWARDLGKRSQKKILVMAQSASVCCYRAEERAEPHLHSEYKQESHYGNWGTGPHETLGVGKGASQTSTLNTRNAPKIEFDHLQRGGERTGGRGIHGRKHIQ